MNIHKTPNNEIEHPETWRTMVCKENPELLKKAQEEVKEDPNNRNEKIGELREMVLAEENLKSPTDDAFLLRFLRARKFDVIQAFKIFKQYYKMRSKYPELFSTYRPSALHHLFREKLHVMLPNTDQEGRRIFIGRTGIWDTSNSTYDDSTTLIHMLIDSACCEEETQINGIIAIFDMKHFGFEQACHGTPSNIKKSVAIFQDCLPARFKGFHFLHEPTIFYLTFLVIKPFLNEKTRSRIFFHGNNLQSLHQHIHPEYLPEEYGGKQLSIEIIAETQTNLLLERDDEIANHEANYGYGKIQS